MYICMDAFGKKQNNYYFYVIDNYVTTKGGRLCKGIFIES